MPLIFISWYSVMKKSFQFPFFIYLYHYGLKDFNFIYWVSLWGDENVLKLDLYGNCTTLNILKTIKLYTLNR